MNTYKIRMMIGTEEVTQTWSGWDEQTAIAQAFLSHAQRGARSIEVLSIELS